MCSKATMNNNRKRPYSDSDNFLNESEAQTIPFQTIERPIVLDQQCRAVYTPNKCPIDKDIISASSYWHQVIINRRGINFPKALIMKGLEEMVENAFFMPVAYFSKGTEDYFFLRKQSKALEQLLKKNLEIKVQEKKIPITLRCCVAKYTPGQLHPYNVIDNFVMQAVNQMKNFTIDLSNLKSRIEFSDIKLFLANRENLYCILDSLACQFEKKCKPEKLKAILLGDNDIKHLAPLQRLSKFTQLESICLKNNDIQNYEEFTYLKNFKLKDINVSGNPFDRDEEGIHKTLKTIIPSLESSDIQRKYMREKVQESFKRKRQNSDTETKEEIITARDVNDNLKQNFPSRTILKNSWNRIVIEHQGKFSSSELIDEMFRHFFMDVPCFPCYYKSGESEDSFLVYLNFQALNTLIQNDLTMMIRNEIITFRIHLINQKFKRGDIRWDERIQRVVEHQIKDDILDLSAFQENSDLKDLIVNLSTTEVCAFVLSCAEPKFKSIRKIDMQENNLTSLLGVNVLKKMRNLSSLNLSKNCIQTLTTLPENLDNITEISLDGNPYCEKYFRNPNMYVQKLMEIFPNLQVIDGQSVDRDIKIVPLQNYIKTRNAYPAVEKFIFFYLKNFEDRNKRKNIFKNTETPDSTNDLHIIYHKDAQLNVCKNGEKEQLTGREQIYAYFSSQSDIEIDYETLSIDAPLFETNRIMYVMNGYFKENRQVHHFSRTFYLKKANSQFARPLGTCSFSFYYQIVNEILHVTKVENYEIMRTTFQKLPPTDAEYEYALEQTITPEAEKQAKILLFKEFTNLKMPWCEIIMNDTDNDLKKACKFFIGLINENAFTLDDFEFNF